MANNRIQIKRTAVAGRTANTTDSGNSQYINAGEFALNMPDGILYTSNGSTLITVGANVVNQAVTGNLTVKAIIANGSIGAGGEVLASNGSAVYWTTVGGTGTVTSVGSGNGLTGGPVTTTGTVSVLANTGIVANATGLFVNSAYIATIAANNASFLGTVAAASYVQNTDSRTLSGNLVISGTSFTPSSNTILLGNSTQRWVLSANTGSFSGAVSGITTLAAGNTTITGFANVTTSVNSALFSVGSSFIANTTGAYHTGVVNAASYTVGTSFTANSTGVYTGNSIANVSITSQISTLGDSTVVPFIATIAANNSFSSGIVMRKIGNTTSSSGIVSDNTELGYHGFSGWDGSGYQRGAFVIARTSQAWSATARGTNYQIYTTPNDTTTNTLRLHVDQSGNIGIGNATPSHRLRVEGDLSLLSGIHANGSLGTAADVLTSNGSSVYWAAAAGGSSNAVYVKGGAAAIGTLAAGGSNLFRVNGNTLNYNTTFVAGENGSATGPITVAPGITLTVETGARVAIL